MYLKFYSSLRWPQQNLLIKNCIIGEKRLQYLNPSLKAHLITVTKIFCLWYETGYSWINVKVESMDTDKRLNCGFIALQHRYVTLHVLQVKQVIKQYRGEREPWWSGYGRRLMFQRSWVRILAPYTGWTIFQIYFL